MKRQFSRRWPVIVLVRAATLALGAAALLSAPVSGQTTIVATPPAGYLKLVARGGSDSLLAVPLLKRAALMARVTAVGPATLTLAMAGVLDGTFSPQNGVAYHAQFVTGNLEGLSFRIGSHGAGGVLLLEAAGENLTAHPLGAIATGAAGDLVRIRPVWTVAEIFGSGTGVVLDSAPEPPGDSYLGADALLFFDNRAAGAEKSPSAVLAFVAGAGWRRRGDGTTDAGTTELSAGYPFLVRRQRTDPAEAVVVGYAPAERTLLRIPAVASDEERDVFVAWAQPGDRALVESGLFSLVPWLGAMEASPDALNVRDALLVYDATRRGFGLPADQRIHFNGSTWYESDVPVDALPLRGGFGYTLRLRGARPLRYWIQPAPN